MPPQLKPAAPPDVGTAMAIHVWNTLGGLDWAGLETACDLFGIADVDLLIHRLAAIRDWQQKED